ncbi:GNAT family N-acetyltransferase [Kitasatospora sp. NPDC101801]|uniref:GNAT family N-acetyltransferase n=1 Tax=Kitasatospora sp. NPDC101801 TaxID=3364103 RepID=UPI00382D3A60
MIIREATAADWPAIWPFLHRIVAAGDTFTWPRDISEELAREIWMKRPPGRTVVAVAADGTVLGSAETHPNQMGPGSHIANAGFMVDAAHGGKGVGRALCAHVIEQAGADGYRAIQYNAVVSTNTRAVELWKSFGFTVLAAVPEGFLHPELGYVDLLVMYLPLAGAEGPEGAEAAGSVG